MEKQKRQWRSDQWKMNMIVGFLLLGFAVFINRDMKLTGFYMDDLYRWWCYGEQTFVQDVFPSGSPRFRFLYNLVSRLELMLIGPHVNWVVLINILLNTGIAFTLYLMAKKYSRNVYVGAVCGIMYLASRLSYYQIGQLLGLMESMALWMALVILYLLCEYLNASGAAKNASGKKGFFLACALYWGICFVHERYMVLFPLFLLVLIFRKERNWRLWASAAGSFAAVQGIRLLTIGSLSPAGTGGTTVAETFSVMTVVKYALSQVAYVFGINAGPELFNGQNFREAPIWVLAMIAVADLMILALVVVFVFHLFRCGKRCVRYLQTAALFICFIGGCIACSSVTIRVEMRWVYVSYTAALLFMAWMYGVVTSHMKQKEMWVQAAPYLAMLTVYALLMLPVENYYRSLFPRLYYWTDQERYNSLAEETYGTYGDEIFGKTIYIIGNDFEMSEFTEETFFKVFDRLHREDSTRVIHIEDVREIGLVTEDMLIIQEDLKHNRFQDVTQTVRNFKCRSLYGYYEDRWMDERAEIQVMAGETGTIDLEFYYPRDLTGDQWITVYVDDEPKEYLELTEDRVRMTIQARPYAIVNLKCETNFFVPNALEQRGEKKLAVLLTITAD